MNALALLFSIVIANAAGLIGAVFTTTSIGSWYSTLTLPAFSPPNWVFGPVWTTLYTIMGISAFLVWKNRKHASAQKALKVYGIHLVLNALWSFLFFGAQNPGWAFIEILFLWAFIVWTMVLFWRERRLAGTLLIPYLAWVSFASMLNYAIWTLN